MFTHNDLGKKQTGKYLEYDFFLPFFAFSNYYRGATKSATERNETECPKIFGQKSLGNMNSLNKEIVI